MRAAVLVALLAFAPPPADPVEEFRDRVRQSRAEEARFFGDAQSRFSDALRHFVLPWERGHSDPSAPQDASWDYEPFLKLYGDYLAVVEPRAAAAERLAASGDPRAAGVLFAELLEVAADADEAEAALAKNMPHVGQQMCDQRPGIHRHGLGRLQRRLVPALARCPGGAAFLAGEGWKRAVAADARASILRRTGVIDALGLAGDAAAVPFLAKQAESKSAVLRIAALEALLRRGPGGTAVLAPLLEDPCPPVRYALLQDLRALEKPDPRWIRLLVEGYPAAAGRPRWETFATLRALTRAPVADDPGKWKEWLRDNAAAVDGGTFVPPAAAGSPSTAEEGGVAFYGARAATRSFLYVVDGSFILRLPADVEIQRTRHVMRWPVRPRSTWEDPPIVQHAVLVKQLRKSLDALPADARFGLLALYGKEEAFPLDDGRMLKASPGATAAAVKFAEGLDQVGFCSVYEGLRAALGAAGLDPEAGAEDFPAVRADTALLVHGGGPYGGRFVTAEPVVEAFGRLNRFRRLLVHGIRISNQKVQAEAVLKGIAEASGGTYHWQAVPPP